MNSTLPAAPARERTGDEVSAGRYRLMADKIEADPSLLDIPLANIARWLANGHSALQRLEGWRAMLLEAKASRAGLQTVLDILRDEEWEAMYVERFLALPKDFEQRGTRPAVMEFPSLIKLITAVCARAAGRRVILFGSSSLFASFPDADPVEIGTAVTIDADFFIEPDDYAVRTALEEALVEDQEYHNTHGFYGDFVDLRMAEQFQAGWRERLVPMPGFDNVFALHPMDMAVSKEVATASSRLDKRFGRRPADRGLKDINTLVALIRAGRLDREELDCRVRALKHESAMVVECGLVLRTLIELSAPR